MHRVWFAVLVPLSLMAGAGRARAAQYEVTVERGVAVKMRDGTVLRADIYRPKAEGRFPVLLQRTPYNKGDGNCGVCMKAASEGFVAIVQDVRGRYTSEGEWYTFKHESEDGYDTVEWAAALPYANGKVGLWGASYVGATQMLAAISSPPHLAGIFPVVTASNYHDGWTYQGGAFEQWFDESWTSGLGLDTLNRRAAHPNALTWVRKLPLLSYPVLDLGASDGPAWIAPYFTDWLAHPGYDDYWKQWAIDEHDANVQVPAYHVGGWYDIFMGGTLRNYMNIKARGGTATARSGQRLMVGPWYHGPFSGKSGDVDFGPEAKGDTDELMLRWYSWLLKGEPNGVEREKPVKIFVMGENRWREEDDWPLPRARTERFYLHSAGKANTLSGDGTLSNVAPQSEPADRYTYNPDDPAPTRGGGLCCDNDHVASGAFDQRPVEAREDVLVYTTPPFEKDFEVTGPVSLELFVSSSAVDTDFTGKLVDVAPNGYGQNLTDGILRARYRNSPERAEMMVAGETTKLVVDLWATSNVFRAGHRLRLEVSSSNFPRFDRNLNTGEEQASATRMVKAQNSVFHDRGRPSALVLQVVPR